MLDASMTMKKSIKSFDIKSPFIFFVRVDYGSGLKEIKERLGY
jgi:hypothetical protein